MVNQPVCLTFLVFAMSVTKGCIIHGTDSGVCTYKYLPKTSESDEVARAEAALMSDLPYCGRWIGKHYAPCVPSTPADSWTAVDQNFPFGRLGTADGRMDIHLIRRKDAWVERTVTDTIQSRIELEKVSGQHHYYQNRDCQDAFARYMCWVNFPRCNDDNGESLPICQSVCENLFRVCGFTSDLWRCETDVVDGEDKYSIRTFFPGQPFKKNDERAAVCTPSITGSAAITNHGLGIWSVLLLTNLIW